MELTPYALRLELLLIALFTLSPLLLFPERLKNQARFRSPEQSRQPPQVMFSTHFISEQRRFPLQDKHQLIMQEEQESKRRYLQKIENLRVRNEQRQREIVQKDGIIRLQDQAKLQSLFSTKQNWELVIHLRKA